MDIATQEGAINIFQSIGCNDNTNCIFFTFKDYSEDLFYFYTGGAIGALVGSAIQASQIKHGSINLSSYEGLLINQTPKGLWIIPLAHTQKMAMTKNAAKMKPLTEKAVFIPNESIQSIKVKKVFLSSQYKIDIKLVDGLSPVHQIVRVKEKGLPYHEANFAAFMSRYRS